MNYNIHSVFDSDVFCHFQNNLKFLSDHYHLAILHIVPKRYVGGSWEVISINLDHLHGVHIQIVIFQEILLQKTELMLWNSYLLFLPDCDINQEIAHMGILL